MAALELDAAVHGRGQNAVWALLLQVLRELAQHAGHADILREQIRAARTEPDQQLLRTPENDALILGLVRDRKSVV